MIFYLLGYDSFSGGKEKFVGYFVGIHFLFLPPDQEYAEKHEEGVLLSESTAETWD